MCVRVRYVSSGMPLPYDGERNVVNIPSHLTGQFAWLALRMVLSELLVQQPQFGALCWCGESVRLPARVTEQQEEEDQVVTHHGA